MGDKERITGGRITSSKKSKKKQVVRKCEISEECPEELASILADKNLLLIRKHYRTLEDSKYATIAHLSSQHNILDVLYGGETSRPMPSWTYEISPEISVTDQQNTGRCWIFATTAVLGHIFRSQNNISNSRAVFSEGYLGFWDLYEKSKLFLTIMADTRDVPDDDPSLCDIMRSGISDGGDYWFALNLLEKYGIVPTDYYPNSSYGSYSTEALVTLINQVLRDNAIEIRKNGDVTDLPKMLNNIFALLCMGFGVPPMPWENLEWRIDQHEMPSACAFEVDKPDERAEYKIKSPQGKPEKRSALSELLASLEEPEEKYSGPVPRMSPMSDDEASVNSDASAVKAKVRFGQVKMPVVESKPSASVQKLETQSEFAAVGTEEPEMKPTLLTKPQPRSVELPNSESVIPADMSPKSRGRRCSDSTRGVERFFRALTPAPATQDIPAEGSSEMFKDGMNTMFDSQRRTRASSPRLSRLSYKVEKRLSSPKKGNYTTPVKGNALEFSYNPRDLYRKFFTDVKFIPLISDERFPEGTRIYTNDTNMVGGYPSFYLNVPAEYLEHYSVESIKRNIPIWFACDVKKQLTPDGGRMCMEMDRLGDLLPETHKKGTKVEEILAYNALANHALIISGVSFNKPQDKKPSAWRIVNSWGSIGRHAGVFVASGEWFRHHVYSINVPYDIMTEKHKKAWHSKDKKSMVQLGPFDPSVI